MTLSELLSGRANESSLDLSTVEDLFADEQSAPGLLVSEPEIDAAAQLPAVLSNRMIASNTPIGMRIAFGEMRSAERLPVFRFATVMSYEDAEQLRDLISRQLSLLKRVELTVGTDGKIVPSQSE